ncbi:MAG TPA: hypothetical protein VEW07_01110 [Solirubrobacterales bacterium]|nr:hypothetical protein [Solirubrobacterales bacterium]
MYAHALGVLALLALAAVGASGCAGMKVAPASVLIEPAGGGNGKAVIVSTGAGEVTKGSANFEITNQAITGAQAAFFEFVGAKTCAGTKWPKVVPFEIKVCNIEVNAKAGSYTSGVTATLETTYKVNAGSAVVLKTPLAQK